MKALDEYFLMVVLTLLLKRIHVVAHFRFNLDRNTPFRRKGLKSFPNTIYEQRICITFITLYVLRTCIIKFCSIPALVSTHHNLKSKHLLTISFFRSSVFPSVWPSKWCVGCKTTFGWHMTLSGYRLHRYHQLFVAISTSQRHDIKDGIQVWTKRIGLQWAELAMSLSVLPSFKYSQPSTASTLHSQGFLLLSASAGQNLLRSCFAAIALVFAIVEVRKQTTVFSATFFANAIARGGMYTFQNHRFWLVHVSWISNFMWKSISMPR